MYGASRESINTVAFVIRFKATLVFIVALIMLAVTSTHHAAALSDTSFSATVSPAIHDIHLLPNQLTTMYSSTIQNPTSAALQVHVSSADFTPLGNSSAGALTLLAANNSTAHGLAKDMLADSSDFILLPLQSRSIKVTIADTAHLAGGGHYGVLLYEILPLLPAGTHGSTVGLKQTIASPVFVSTQGSGTYGLQLFKPELGIAWLHLPKSYAVAFRNTGNVQLVPRGYINLTGPTGAQQAKTIINSDSGMILPDTNRLFSLPADNYSKPSFPGIYTLRTYYRYDGSSTYSLQSQKFFYVGYPLMAGLIAIAGAVVVAILRISEPGKRLIWKLKNR